VKGWVTGKVRGLLLLGLSLSWVALVGAPGCDWFNAPVEANIPPDTEMDICPSHENITIGDDVTFAWSGSDVDGAVAVYEWTFGDESGETTSESLTIEDVVEGSHTFTVSAVDDGGDRDATPAECKIVVTRATRVVLVELFTTKFCTFCPEAETALMELLDEYGSSELCVVGYHYWREGYSPPDPLATEETTERIEWYTGGTPGFPRATFDGLRYVSGAPSVTEAKANYRAEIDLRRAQPSPVTLSLAGGVRATRGDVTARVRVREPLGAGPNVLRVVVFENDVFSDGETYEFVTRDILDDQELDVSAVGDSAVVTTSFTLDPAWDGENIDVIAFIQDDSSKEVLQSARLSRE